MWNRMELREKKSRKTIFFYLFFYLFYSLFRKNWIQKFVKCIKINNFLLDIFQKKVISKELFYD